MESLQVSAVMKRRPVSVREDASLDEAMALMDGRDIRHFPVVGPGKPRGVVGVISDRDLLELTGWLHPRQREWLEAPSGCVREFMHAPAVTAAPGDSLASVVERIVGRRIGCLPVVDGGELVGILTESDLLRVFLTALEKGRIAARHDQPVEDCVHRDAPSVAPDTPATEAAEQMHGELGRHLLVIEEERVAGVLSDRDLRLATGRGELDGTPVRELMAPEPVTVEAGERLSAAARHMVEGRFGALPVTRGGRPFGLLVLADLLAPCLEALQAARVAGRA